MIKLTKPFEKCLTVYLKMDITVKKFPVTTYSKFFEDVFSPIIQKLYAHPINGDMTRLIHINTNRKIYRAE